MPDLILDSKRQQELGGHIKKLVQLGAVKDDILKFSSEFKNKFGVDRAVAKQQQDKIDAFPKLKDVAQTRFETKASDIGATIPSIGLEAKQAQEIVEAPERIKLREKTIAKNKEIALDNNTEKVLTSSGVKFTKNDAIYKKTRDSILTSVNDGNLVLSVDAKTNLPVYKRSLGIAESFIQGLETSRQEINKAEEFRKADNKKRIALAEKYMTESEEQGIPSGFLGETAAMFGGAVPQVGRAMVGGAVASMLPVQAKLVVAAGSFLAMLPSAAEQSYRQSTIQAYSKGIDELKRQKRLRGEIDELSEKEKEDAMGVATTQGVVGAAAEGIVVAGLSSIPVGGVIAGNSLKKAIKQFAKNTSIESARQTALGTSAEFIKGAAEAAAGYNTTFSETLNKSLDRFGQDAIAAVSFEVAFNALKFPKYVQSAAKNYISSMPVPEFNGFMKDLEGRGVVPEGSTEKIRTEVDAYDSAKGKVAPVIPEEDMPSFAGLIEKKTNLENQKKSSDPAFHAKIDEQIAAIDQRIVKMQESPDPILDEVDELTGDSGDVSPITKEQIIRDIEINQGGPIRKESDAEINRTITGVNYEDIVVGNDRLEDILEKNNLSNDEKNSIRDVFSRGIEYFKFDKEGSQKFQERFSNPEDIESVSDIIFGVSASKESDFIQHNERNYRNVKDAINYIANNPKEYSKGVVKTALEIKSKIDNPSSSFDRIYAIDIMKELGIQEPVKESKEGFVPVEEFEEFGVAKKKPERAKRAESEEGISLKTIKSYTKKEQDSIIDEIGDPIDARQAAMRALTRGVRVNTDSFISELGFGAGKKLLKSGRETTEAALNPFTSKTAFSVEKTAERIIETLPDDKQGLLNSQDVRNELIDILQDYDNLDDIRAKYISDYYMKPSYEQDFAVWFDKKSKEAESIISDSPERVTELMPEWESWMREEGESKIAKELDESYIDALIKQYEPTEKITGIAGAEEVRGTEKVISPDIIEQRGEAGEYIAKQESAEISPYESWREQQISDEPAFQREYEQNRVEEQGETREQYLLRKYCQQG